MGLISRVSSRTYRCTMDTAKRLTVDDLLSSTSFTDKVYWTCNELFKKQVDFEDRLNDQDRVISRQNTVIADLEKLVATFQPKFDSQEEVISRQNTLISELKRKVENIEPR